MMRLMVLSDGIHLGQSRVIYPASLAPAVHKRQVTIKLTTSVESAIHTPFTLISPKGGRGSCEAHEAVASVPHGMSKLQAWRCKAAGA